MKKYSRRPLATVRSRYDRSTVVLDPSQQTILSMIKIYDDTIRDKKDCF